MKGKQILGITAICLLLSMAAMEAQSVSISGLTSYNTGQKINLTASPTGFSNVILSYQWYNETANANTPIASQTTNSFIEQTAQPGIFNYSVNVNDGIGNNIFATTISITVSRPPSPPSGQGIIQSLGGYCHPYPTNCDYRGTNYYNGSIIDWQTVHGWSPYSIIKTIIPKNAVYVGRGGYEWDGNYYYN